MFKSQEITYRDVLKSVQLSNNFVDVIIAKEFGPRIVHFGLRGQPNMFSLNEEQLHTFRESKQYQIVGGHRLWTAPEDLKSTYLPDNFPVTIEPIANGAIVSQPAGEITPFYKAMQIELSEKYPLVTMTHTIRNDGMWSIKMAPWALSVMAPGGLGIMPLPPRGSHSENLLPNGGLVFWPYTNFADPRWRWGFENICVQQEPSMEIPLKFGMAANIDWIGYANHNALFVKKTSFKEGAEYPDRGTPYQIFLNHRILEVESMGPLTVLEPGQTVIHTETWALLENVEFPINDTVIKEDLQPRIEQVFNQSAA
ncbi:MAG: hypothetical protein CL609_05440 [Anaerolineaceae bacterium]|nr:hypothetical protein [Anaerolineaceae bacterium]